MVTLAAASRWLTFETALGWISLAIGERGLERLSLSVDRPSMLIGEDDSAGPELPTAAGPHAGPSPQLERQAVMLLRRYCQGEPTDLTELPVAWPAGLSPFQRQVLQACRLIQYGQVVTYAQLAAATGRPRAYRAVGNVMASNRLPLVIPCHRVIRSDRQLGGFSAPSGVSLKRRLLELEAAGIGVPPGAGSV